MSPFSPIPPRAAPASSPNPPDDDSDGEEEVDLPGVAATGKRGRGGITSRGRGTSGRQVAQAKRRRY